MRIQHLLGLAFVGVSLIAINGRSASPPVEPPVQIGLGDGNTGGWFATAKPFCNALEVDVHLRQAPPPATDNGTAYGIACRAIAGQISMARTQIQQLTVSAQGHAAQVLFQVGHPIADAGDDRAAGPIMELVLEFWPNNYMAMYHAGMSAYATNRSAAAERYLSDFLVAYPSGDGWRAEAVRVLDIIEDP